MRCPKCGSLNDYVIDSRSKKDNTIIRRRRKCKECQNCWTTYETQTNYLSKDKFKEDIKNLFISFSFILKKYYQEDLEGK
jgi:transcriptional regulator NrdR family protein